MSDKLKLALVQMNSGSWNAHENVDKAVGYVDQAAKDGSELITVPEFFNHPYVFQYRDYKYLDYAEKADGYAISTMRQRAKAHGVHIVATILEEEGPGVYYDASFVIDPNGEVLGKYRKVHPAAVRSLEKIYFRPGNRYPIFDIRGWKVGINICYDHFFPETARATAVAGAELILGPFAAPAQYIWEHLMRVRAWENGVYLAPCNKVGPEGDWVFHGTSMVVAPTGEIVVQAGSEEDEIIHTELDRSVVYQTRRSFPMMRDRRPDAYRILSTVEEDVRRLI